MQFAVVSIFIGSLPYKQAAIQNHRAYCERHDYTYICVQESLNEYHPMWQKPDVVRELLDKGYEYVFWMDGDSFFIDQARSLSSFTEAHPTADLIAAGDENDLINTGHLLFKNTLWTRTFIDRWLAFRRPLQHETLRQFRAVTTHFIGGTFFNDQPPIAIMMGGGSPDKEAEWITAFNSVNLYAGNPNRQHSSAAYSPTCPENLERAHSLIAPSLRPHVRLVVQGEMNAYPNTFVKGDFILHFVSHKHAFEQILAQINEL